MKASLTFLIPFLILFLEDASHAQSVGIGTPNPNSSAQLDISSTTKGLLAPRMSTAQRTAIVSPAKGLLVYDTDVNGLFHYNGSVWTSMAEGGLVLPFSGSVSHAGAAFSIGNLGSGPAILASAVSNSTAAIQGSSSATSGGYGVFGSSSSASSFGVGGSNPSGVAVYGFSANGGTALRGVSPTGYALNISGNVRISGGNTNPSNGAVLTSDASGNAVWKPHRVGFHAGGVNTNYTSVPNQSARRVQFGTTDFYDLTNSYTILVGTNYLPSVSSTYTVPVEGVYHFDIKVNLLSPWGLNSDPTPLYGELVLKRNRDGVVSEIARQTENAFGEECCQASIDLSISKDIYLQAGDILYVEVYQYNEEGATYTIVQFPNTYFNGHLVIPQ